MSGQSSDVIRVLHVDDESSFSEMAAEFLERQNDRFDVETATSASDALEWLSENTVDCVVSDFNMPGQDGIEFLEAVREEYPDLPFILYTGKGSEEVASEAISAGVTEYLQKEAGTSQYEVLAKRIGNAVERQRAQQAAAETEQRLQTIAENTNDMLWKFTADWSELLFINSPYEEITGRSIDELRNEPQSFLEGVHPDDRATVEDAMDRLSAGESVDIEYRVNADENYGRWVWIQGEPVMDKTGEVEKVVGFARDITDRKERERELEEIYGRISDAFFALDEDWVFTHLNEQAHELINPDGRELEGKHIWDEFPAATERTFKPKYEKAMYEQETVSFEEYYPEPLNAWFEVRAYPSETGLSVYFRDITERKRQGRKREQIIGRVTDAIVEVDADWQFTLVNEQAEELYDMSATSLLGRDFWEVFEEAKGTRFEEEYRHVMETREPTSFTEYFSQLDGWFDINVYPRDDGGLAFYFVEVTEIKEREQELQNLTKQLQDVIDSVEAAMWIRTKDGEYQYMNQYHRDQFDIADDAEVAGKQFADLLPVEVAEKFLENDRRVYESEEPVEIEETVETEDGPKDFLTRIIPLFDDGSVYATCGIATDITDQKARERQLEQFAGVVSHDLRNPLNIIEGRLELAREDCDSDHLEPIGTAVDRMNRIINDLLWLAREGKDIGTTEPVDLQEAVETACEIVVDSPDNLEFDGGADGDWTIVADEDRLAQLLENIFRNSLEHGGEDVTVSVGILDDGFYIEDDGPGIPKDEQDHVFEAGYSTSEDGTGFGLSIVRQVVEAHDWEIHISEGAEGGARFEITGVEFVAA